MGPFDYSALQMIFLYLLLKFYLKYPERIMVREQEGLDMVRKFSQKNIEKSMDMVLKNEEYDLEKIFRKKK